MSLKLVPKNLNPLVGLLACLLALNGASSAATFYVSPTGADSSPGTTEAKPFRMVQHAIDEMSEGDTLLLLDGVYTGTLKLKSGITLKSKNPRKVIFSGAKALTGDFEKHSDTIYKIKIDADPKQLFYQGQPMTWACWPNLTWSENWVGSKKWISTKVFPGKIACDEFSALQGLDLVDGYCFLRYSKGNSCYSRRIKSFDGTTLVWDDENFYSGAFTGEDGRRGAPWILKDSKRKTTGGRFFLAGALDLLDSEGEWFAKDGVLYLYAPGGVQPKAADVFIQSNDYVIHETAPISNLTLEGIDFFATSVQLANLENEKIIARDCRFSYIGSELLFVDSVYARSAQKPIDISGTQILIDDCLFVGAQNSALQMNGSELVVQNCVFAENNRHANFESRGLVMSPRGTFKVTRNTFFNNCSDAIRIQPQEGFERTVNPEVSFNNICNAGIYNSDVSGVYFPHLSMENTDFHHNWVHNVKGNGVRLDQAGEEMSVHHNVFWSSKRGLNIEGYGKFNIYNNTSVLNKEPCAMTRNVVPKRKGSNPAMVSNDISFAPISDWNILNNLVQKFEDRVGPSEKGPFENSKSKGTLHPERKKEKSLPIEDRGSVQGNLTDFKLTIFESGDLANLNLIPISEVVENGAAPTAELKEQGVTDLDRFRGAYDLGKPTWSAGSDWMPYGIAVPKTMAESELFSRKYRSLSVVPQVELTGISQGVLNTSFYTPPPTPKTEPPVSKKKKKKKKASKK